MAWTYHYEAMSIAQEAHACDGVLETSPLYTVDGYSVECSCGWLRFIPAERLRARLAERINVEVGARRPGKAAQIEAINRDLDSGRVRIPYALSPCPEQVADESVWQRECIGTWSDPPTDPAHDRMVEEFSGGPKRDLIPCDGDPECTWAAKRRYAYDANLCAHHLREADAASCGAISRGRLKFGDDLAAIRRSRTNETGPSAVASAPSYRGGVQVYCQGEE